MALNDDATPEASTGGPLQRRVSRSMGSVIISLSPIQPLPTCQHTPARSMKLTSLPHGKSDGGLILKAGYFL